MDLFYDKILKGDIIFIRPENTGFELNSAHELAQTKNKYYQNVLILLTKYLIIDRIYKFLSDNDNNDDELR